MPAGSFMRRIQERGRLIAGVDQNTLLFGYLDPATGGFRGFEVDLLRELARAIFGDPSRVEFKAALTTRQRLQYVQNGSVDIVADAITITCDRLRDVAFSSVYYDAAQRLLVPANSPARRAADLREKRVCARAGTTSFENLARQPFHPAPVPVQERTDCLVLLQERKVDAITSDDSILRGFQEQDPYTKLLPGSLEPEPYGMAIAKSHPEFVRFVNGVLQKMRSDGRWGAIYRRWLGSPVPVPPAARYRD
ncbi:MAG: glutamate ABC transporter substrate-binding protein [Syntrophomonadaceae bacterium]